MPHDTARGFDRLGRRAWLLAGAGMAAASVGGARRAARAQAAHAGVPFRPVRVVQGYTPGGPTDLLARILGDGLSATWGQPVVVESRPGASASIAAAFVARSAPDGHTLGLLAATHVQTPPLLPRLPYHALNDFTPVAQVAGYPLILVVHPSVPARTLAEFVAHARSHPSVVTFATAGIGSSPHLSAAQLALRSGAEFTYVQYSGTAQGQTAVLTGECKAMFLNPLLAVPIVRDGRARALASSGSRRWRDFPEVPTVAEQGHPGYDAEVWYGVFGPAGLPPELLSKLEADIIAAVRAPEVRARMTTTGFDALEVGAAEFRALVASELEKWAEIIRRTGIRGAE